VKPLNELWSRLAQLSRKGPVMGEAQRFLLLSIIIGIFSGLIVVCFHMTIEFFNWNTVHGAGQRNWLVVLLWPAAGGGVAYLLTVHVFPSARGSGVNFTKAALYASDGYVPFNGVTGKFIASTISIGSGNPMGPEDPALQMGAGIASLLGRMFRLTRDNMRLIAPVGAAAGIGAAFNTPITAVLFVMEEVVAEWSTGVLGSIVLSAVSAVVVTRWFLGDDPLYSVPDFALSSYWELFVYAAIGLLGGLLSAWFTRFVVGMRARAISAPTAWKYALPVLAGLAVGAVGIRIPEILGAGYEGIDSALNDRYVWYFLLLLGALKMVSTAVCFSAGTPGGMFAPTLFIGAMLGGGIGGLAHEYLPLATSPASAYVLVGIGTFFAGVFRAPMTSIFMVFETSASYVIILPVMVSNTISFLVSRQLQHESLLQIVGRQDGLDLPSVEEAREAPRLSIEDAMRKGDQRVLRSDWSVSEALERMRARGAERTLVGAGWSDWTWIERGDLESTVEAGQGAESVAEALRPRSVIRVYPDQSLESALWLLGPYPILPVMSRVNPGLLLGTLTLEDVERAYGIGQDRSVQ